MEGKTLKDQIAYLVNDFDDHLATCIGKAHDCLDKEVDGEFDKLHKKSDEENEAYLSDLKHDREILRDLYAEVFALRAAGDPEDSVQKKIKAHFEERERKLASHCKFQIRCLSRTGYLADRVRCIREKMVKESE